MSRRDLLRELAEDHPIEEMDDDELSLEDYRDRLSRMPDPLTCPKFGHQDECPQPEPVECDGFSFCEFVTTQNKHKKRSEA